jgi:small neutral amino acid transporter SnatA (MarC family)
VLLLVSRDPARLFEWIAALTVAMLISATVLVFSGHLQRLLGERVLIAVERLMGLVLTAISVEMILKGLRIFIAEVAH